MKNRFLIKNIILLLGVYFLVGCNNVEMEETVSADGPIEIVYLEFSEQNVQDSTSEGTSENDSGDELLFDEMENDEASNQSENDSKSLLDGKVSFVDYMTDNNLDYYGEIVCFAMGENVFTDMLDSKYDKFSLVLDLDNDGIEEAFVCDAMEYDEKGILIDSICFFDEQMNMNVIMNEGYLYIKMEQYLLKNDLYSYVTLNGYNGIDPIGFIYSYIDDKCAIITDELLQYGRKYFVSSDELLWIRSGYMNCYDIDEDTDEGFWNGRSFIPYFYKIENNELFLITAEEKNINEINEIAVFNIDDYTDAESVQFLLRENGELEVNYVKSDFFGYNFYSDIYYIEDNEWVYKYWVHGYYVPDPVNYSKTDWEFIEELK